MDKFSNQAIESIYTLIKILLDDKENDSDDLDDIKKDISYMSGETKKKLKDENFHL